MFEQTDILIIGGGSAGCVLANRLSADPNRKVVLLEAGRGDRHPLHAFPMLTGHYFKRPKDNWSFMIEPQRELDGRTMSWPRGKRIGGSSIFNGMVYARGNAGDYDHWAQLGNRGWSYDEVLPFFKKNEQHEDGESDLHGGSGLLSVGHARASNPLFKAFIEAGVQAGYRFVKDLNGPDPTGVGYYDFHIRRGKRSNSAGELLRQARRRPNLKIIDNALVTRLTFDQERRATGASFIRGGREQTIIAAREVVLSAGVIGSPQILMLSGVGPSSHLQKIGVAPTLDLPGVGENLVDHLDSFIKTASVAPISLLRELRIDRITLSVARAYAFGTGPVAESPISAGGYFHSREGLAHPDLQAFFVPVMETGAAVWLPGTARARSFAEKHGYGLRIGPIRPLSRGRITLRSPDPLASPVIDPAYLTDESDAAAMVAGLKIAREILRQPAFSPFRKDETAPGPDVTSDDGLKEYIRQTAGTVYHPVGTAKMGSDRYAVVDERLRVHGIQGLRIADASVMPTIPSGNTNAPTMMVAEKASDMIVQDERL